jgi:hypothetical protein
VAEALRSVRRLRDGNVGLSPKDQRLRTYLDQVANFITQNTQGATIGQSQEPAGADPWGSQGSAPAGS